MSSDEIDDIDKIMSETITCNAGDVLIFNPLLVHASSKISSDEQRAVLHLEAIKQKHAADTVDWFETHSPLMRACRTVEQHRDPRSNSAITPKNDLRAERHNRPRSRGPHAEQTVWPTWPEFYGAQRNKIGARSYPLRVQSAQSPRQIRLQAEPYALSRFKAHGFELLRNPLVRPQNN